MQEVCSGRLLLQSDWKDALRQEDREIWAGYEYEDKDRVSSFTRLSLSATDDDGNVPSSDRSFKARIKENECRISFEQESLSCCSTFIAPVASFSHSQGHKVQSMDVSGGGLGISSKGAEICLWNTANGQILRTHKLHLMDVYRCRFFPSGQVVLSGGGDMMLKIWSVMSGNCPRTLCGHTQGISDVGMIDRGRNVVSCSKDGTCKLWVCSSSDCLLTLNPESGPLNSLTLTPSCVVDAERDGRDTGVGGKMVLLGSDKGSTFGYCLNSGERIFEYQANSAINTVSMYDENKCMFGTDLGSIYFVDLRKTEEALFHYKTTRGGVFGLLPWQEGFFSCFADGTVLYRKELSGRVQASMELSCADCDAVYEIRTDGSHLFTSSRDGIIRKYRLPKENPACFI